MHFLQIRIFVLMSSNNSSGYRASTQDNAEEGHQESDFDRSSWVSMAIAAATKSLQDGDGNTGVDNDSGSD